MKLWAAVLLLAVAAQGRDLVPHEFNKEVRQAGRDAFIKFYAPWCGHCKRLQPVWDKLTLEHHDTWGFTSPVMVASVDCTDRRNRLLCSEHKIQGYPTLVYFRGKDATNTESIEYRGPRGFEDLRSFVKEAWKAAHADGVKSAAAPVEESRLPYVIGAGVCGVAMLAIYWWRRAGEDE
eukprot:TRINITY_DN3093_c1_g1_i2.p2 TRINITY_DN3093_c1_g1~~TRINITY_DN3093_c1_g1_i2.p2  ORF type:complete len:178 (+),score=52.62 TRINITY_DN3093_c1_g1_i2:85-618(+)